MDAAAASLLVLDTLADISSLDSLKESDTLSGAIHLHETEILESLLRHLNSNPFFVSVLYLPFHEDPLIRTFGAKLLRFCIQQNLLTSDAIQRALDVITYLMRQPKLPSDYFISRTSSVFWGGLFTILTELGNYPKALELIVNAEEMIKLIFARVGFISSNPPDSDALEILRVVLIIIHTFLKTEIWNYSSLRDLQYPIFKISRTDDYLLQELALKVIVVLLNFANKNEKYPKYLSRALIDVGKRHSQTEDSKRRLIFVNAIIHMVHEPYAVRDSFVDDISFKEEYSSGWVTALMAADSLPHTKEMIEYILKKEAIQIEKQSNGVSIAQFESFLPILWKSAVNTPALEQCVKTVSSIVLPCLPRKSTAEQRYKQTELFLSSFYEFQQRASTVGSHCLYMMWSPSKKIRSQFEKWCSDLDATKGKNETSTRYALDYAKKHPEIFYPEFQRCIERQTDLIMKAEDKQLLDLRWTFFFLVFSFSCELIEALKVKTIHSASAITSLWKMIGAIIVCKKPEKYHTDRYVILFECASALVDAYGNEELFNPNFISFVILWSPLQISPPAYKKVYYKWLYLYFTCCKVDIRGAELQDDTKKTISAWLAEPKNQLRQYGIENTLRKCVGV